MIDLLIQNHQSPGDVLALTRAVRSLHECHPGKYQTAVSTNMPALWDGNPFVTPLSELKNPRHIKVGWSCSNSNNENRHFIWHITGDLARQINVPIHVKDCRGDLYLTEPEISAPIAPLAGTDKQFWVIMPGGKTDMKVKIWPSDYYQAVIDHFAGRIQFVQVGHVGSANGGVHINPELKGVINIVGKTHFRDLIRLFHHAQGVLCGVTFGTHLAAAVPMPANVHGRRPCVVIAGGREDVGTIQYTGHRVVDMAGALPCCVHGGCFRLGLCEHNDGTYAKCMRLLKPERVVDAIDTYFAGGRLEYLK